MADDTSQDQTQTILSADQPPVETPPEQQPTTEQPKAEEPANTVPSETPTAPTLPNSPNPEPQPAETSQQIQPETPVPSETQPQPEQTQPVAPSTETQPPVYPPVINIPALYYPFSGNIPVTFAFGAQSENEEIKKKFQEWGIVGHNGLDFGMGTGNEVFPCDSGKVIQSGDNGDFGISITIQHSWGQSLYAHLSETKVNVDEEIQSNKVIGLSGSSGAAFGEHLHFAIKPNNSDSNNGYLGFIDPAPYLSLPSQKEESQTPPAEEQKPSEQPPQEIKAPETPQQPVQEPPKPEETPPPINYESEKQTEPAPQQTENPQQSENPLSDDDSSKASQTPRPSDEEIQKQVNDKLKTELDTRRQKANEARTKKKEDNRAFIRESIKSFMVLSEGIRKKPVGKSKLSFVLFSIFFLSFKLKIRNDYVSFAVTSLAGFCAVFQSSKTIADRATLGMKLWRYLLNNCFLVYISVIFHSCQSAGKLP